ncbi:MAG TPA: hypothetical protein ENN57_02725, partial [Chloroflexi bacterium]|nr:hypothetical protein [Chloroflexota bacterium]
MEDIPQGVASTRCFECGHKLRFDSAMLFWRCTNPKCRRIYTHDELRKAGVEKSTFHRSDFQSRDISTSTHNNENWVPYTPPGRKSRKIGKIIAITLASIFAIVVVAIAAPFSPSVSVNPASIRFTVDDGLNPPAQILEIQGNRGIVSWSANTDTPWLGLDPVNGSTDEETSITLSVDISEMYPGEYATTATIAAPDARNTLLKVPV